MIDFELFSRLYRETADYTDVSMYIGERGYQADWMELVPDPGKLLSDIWGLAHMDIVQLRERTGLTKAAFAARYGIPYRTIQNWEATGSEHREPPEYLKMLIAYTISDND